jgi:transposase-like protein
MSREILVDALPGEVVLPVLFHDEAKLRRAKQVVGRRAERGLSLAHTTILRWMLRNARAFAKRWNRFGTPMTQSWRVDEM